MNFIKKIFSRRKDTPSAKKKGRGGIQWRPSDPTWELAKMPKSDDELSNPYKQHAWVYACIRDIATNIAQLPVKLIDERNNKEITGHALREVFRRPNDLWTQWHLWEGTVSHLQSSGNAIWVLQRGSPQEDPLRIYVFSPNDWKVETDDKGNITHYLQRISQTNYIRYPAYNIVHFRLFNPESDLWGVGPLTAARICAEQDYEADKYNKAFFNNSAIPGGIITFPEGEDVDPEQWNQIKRTWENLHSGSENAFKLASITGGATFQQLGVSHKDMLFIEQKRWSRQEILSCFRVPPTEVGVHDDVHKAVGKEIKKGYWHDTLLPIKRLIEETLRAQFFGNYRTSHMRLVLDVSAVGALQEDEDAKVKRVKTLWEMGVPFNVLNEKYELGFEPVPGGDTGYVPVNLIDADSAGKGEAPKEEPKPKKAVTKSIEPRKIHTPEEEAYWKAWVNDLSPHETRFKENLRTYFKKMQKHLDGEIEKAASLSEIGFATLALSDDWNEELRKITNKHYIKTLSEYGPRIEEHIADAGIDYKFDHRAGAIKQLVDNKTIKVVGINDRIRRKLRDSLATAFNEGKTVQQFSEDIHKVIHETPDPSKSRSLTIARTETADIANTAEYMSFQEAGVKWKKWIAMMDAATRPTHIDAHLQGAIEMHELFVNGLAHPHDPMGSAEERINCRCVLKTMKEPKR